MESASGELADAATAREVSTVCCENSVEGKSVGLGKEEEMWHMHMRIHAWKQLTVKTMAVKACK